jgi:hypothetical protein
MNHFWLGEIAKYGAKLNAADLLIIDDLFLRRLPSGVGDNGSGG